MKRKPVKRVKRIKPAKRVSKHRTPSQIYVDVVKRLTAKLQRDQKLNALFNAYSIRIESSGSGYLAIYYKNHEYATILLSPSLTTGQVIRMIVKAIKHLHKEILRQS